MQVKYGQKYIKIIRDNSVWGFIVNTDNDKVFKKGDILKFPGWNAPARNARGNIFDDDYYINWTGPLLEINRSIRLSVIFRVPLVLNTLNS